MQLLPVFLDIEHHLLYLLNRNEVHLFLCRDENIRRKSLISDRSIQKLIQIVSVWKYTVMFLGNFIQKWINYKPKSLSRRFAFFLWKKNSTYFDLSKSRKWVIIYSVRRRHVSSTGFLFQNWFTSSNGRKFGKDAPSGQNWVLKMTFLKLDFIHLERLSQKYTYAFSSNGCFGCTLRYLHEYDRK